MKKVAFYIVLAMSFLVVLSCDNDEPNQGVEEILRINHYTIAGHGPFLRMYNLVQKGDAIGTNDWEIFYAPVENFEYELGYVYEILVNRSEIEDPPQDIIPIRYTLKEVISKEKTSRQIEFEVKLRQSYTEESESYVTGSIDSGFKILDQIIIDCNQNCNLLIDAQNEEELVDVIGIFRHTEEANTIKLIDLKNL
ncbi:DUF4377 domain-containing protein [Ulvibacterium sp.]|uniref:DUF4377 domain-containing protein n=1 Tax=Ulvibacterium sp. TaxID=2665914 RepID=UPI003BA994F2